MNMQNVKTVEFKGFELRFEIAHGHVWLVAAPGVLTPLAMQYDSEGGRYAYVTSGVGDSFLEGRIYEDGSFIV